MCSGPAKDAAGKTPHGVSERFGRDTHVLIEQGGGGRLSQVGRDVSSQKNIDSRQEQTDFCLG